MSWTNSDGLYVKFGTEESAVARGGEYNVGGNPSEIIEFTIGYEDVQSATEAILGTLSTDAATTGTFGVVVPKGLFVESIEVICKEAFQSTGTVGSATMVIGFIREDRSTTYDIDGLTTSSFAGSVWNTVGLKTTLVKGSTGAGALVGTTLANDGLIVVSNSTHTSGPHPFGTTGKLTVRVKGYYPNSL